jgi:hypothetical protein
MRLTCTECGAPFEQLRGRPAKRCPRHSRARYGAEHRRLVAETREAAYGTPCVRCGGIMLLGDQLDLDHADDGEGYLGWAHAACNRSAGATRGNRLRAAHRAAMGLWGPDPARARIPVRRPAGLDSSRWTDDELVRMPPIPDKLMGAELRGVLVWSAAGNCWGHCSRVW